MKYLAILIAILFSSCTAFAQQCYTFGHACGGMTVTQCCDGLLCAKVPGSTVSLCVQGVPPSTTTTTEPTVTTTTVTVSTTTSTTQPQGATYPDAGLRFSVDQLRAGPSAQFTGQVPDPRNGQPANQFVLATMDWQLKALVGQAVAALDAAGKSVNETQVTDAAFKFGGDYWLKHAAVPESGAYQVLQPTYVRQYTLPTIVAAGLAGGVPAQALTIPEGDVLDGLLTYTPKHYKPLTSAQCGLLAAADAAHMKHDMDLLKHDMAAAAADDPAVDATELAFERSARDVSEATLFTWTWDPDYNTANPQDVLDGLTRGVIQAHTNATLSFNCMTGSSPDVGAIVHFRMLHNFLHIRRGTVHWLDKPTYTVCPNTQISSCPRLTSRQWAGQF